MLGATAVFLAMTAFVKALREDGFSTAEVSFWRTAPGLPWLYWELYRRGIPLRPRSGGWMAARVLFGSGAMACNFAAVRSLTLVQHTVLHLAQPVFVALLSPLLLRERLHRVVAAALGLALLGALLVIRPDLALAGLGALPLAAGLLALASAGFSALAHVALRGGTRTRDASTATDAPEAVVFHFMLWTAALSAAWALLDGGLRPCPDGIPLAVGLAKIGAMAGLGVVGQLLLARAYALADAAEVAMVAYAAIPLGLVLDALVWGLAPSASSLGGAVLMVAAGILLARRHG